MLRELAHDGTTDPGGTAGDYDNATLVHVAGIPSEPMRMRWATTPDPLLLLAAATLVAFGDFYAYGAYTPRSLRLVAYGCLALGAALLLPRVRASYDVLLPQLSIVTLVVWQGLTLVRATMIYGHGHALSEARYISIALSLLAAAAIVTTPSSS